MKQTKHFFMRMIVVLLTVMMCLPLVSLAHPGSQGVLPVKHDKVGKPIFSYQGDDSVQKVTVAGDFNNWNPDQLVLQKEDNNLFRLHWTGDWTPGRHEYKFIINDQWLDGDNLSFESPTLPTDQTKKVVVHFDNPDKATDYNVWLWSADPDLEGDSYDFDSQDDYGSMVTIELSSAVKKIGLILRQGQTWDRKDIENDRFVDLTQDETHIWLKKGVEEVFTQNPNPKPTKKTVIFHFNQLDTKEWKLHVWPKNQPGQDYPFTEKDDFGWVAKIDVDPAVTEVGFLVKDDQWNKNISDDRYVTLTQNPTHVWLRDKDPKVYDTKPFRLDEEPLDIVDFSYIDESHLELVFNRKGDLTYFMANYELLLNGTSIQDQVDTVEPDTGDITAANKLRLSLKAPVDVTKNLSIDYQMSAQAEPKNKLASLYRYVRTPEFDQKFYYDGPLGAYLDGGDTVFRVWAPTATAVYLKTYENGVFKSRHLMTRLDKGVHEHRLSGNQEGLAYLYEVQVDGKVNEAVDPYAKAVTLNGKQGVVAFVEPSSVANPGNLTHPIIYELHVRDFSKSPTSGIHHKGKFLGLIEKNTKSDQGQVTGLDYLKGLGVTHIQLLPIFDYATVDESNIDASYNWGYDPQNYNAVEGSYSTQPSDPMNRINELKLAVDGLHKEGLGVIMDVVYNHVHSVTNHSFEKIVPGYYFRRDDQGQLRNGTGVGNETASEHKMVRRYMVDSVSYWAKTFKLDGFRFDLMGIHDVTTMKEIERALKAINPNIFLLGEGWDMGDGLRPDQKANQNNANQLPGYAFFSDNFRDSIKGDNFNATGPGFATGNPTNEAYVLQNILGSNGLKTYQSARQVIQYVEVHDNLTLWDKLLATNPGADEATLLNRHRLATTMVLLSQGTPLLHAGQEFARTKGGEHNSYNAPDQVNQLDWDRALKNKDLISYVQEVIKIRKAHPIFKETNYSVIGQKAKTLMTGQGVVAYQLADEGNKTLVLAYNGSTQAQTLTLEKGNYQVLVEKQEAKADGLRSFNHPGGTLTIDGLSSLVLVKTEEVVSPNKAALKALIDEVRAIPSMDNYTNESGENLRRALGLAQQVLEDPNASQDAINKAHKDLLEAKNNLKTKPTDSQAPSFSLEDWRRAFAPEIQKGTPKPADTPSKEKAPEKPKTLPADKPQVQKPKGSEKAQGAKSLLRVEEKAMLAKDFSPELQGLLDTLDPSSKLRIYDIYYSDRKVDAPRTFSLKVALKKLGLDPQSFTKARLFVREGKSIVELENTRLEGEDLVIDRYEEGLLAVLEAKEKEVKDSKDMAKPADPTPQDPTPPTPSNNLIQSWPWLVAGLSGLCLLIYLALRIFRYEDRP